MGSVAIITDIHGNLPALAVVDGIAPDATYCDGADHCYELEAV